MVKWWHAWLSSPRSSAGFPSVRRVKVALEGMVMKCFKFLDNESRGKLLVRKIFNSCDMSLGAPCSGV